MQHVNVGNFYKAPDSPEIQEMDITLKLSSLRTEVCLHLIIIRQAILFLRWPVVKRCDRQKEERRKEEEEDSKR